jgi:hypothetical protein
MKGGQREGAGRPKGALSQRNSEVAAECIAEGISPLEFMLKVMRNPRAPSEKRFEAAKMAAPYCHPRLSTQSIELRKEPTVEDYFKNMSDEDLDAYVDQAIKTINDLKAGKF